jgi:hypothetical protein
MAYALKKIHVAITALLLTVVGQVHGDYGHTSNSGECENSCPCAPACGKGFISADLLYWRAFEGGLDECFPVKDTDYISSSGDIISKFRGRGQDPRFKWDPGFRLGAGYEFASGWDVAVFWTRFHSSSSRHHRNQYEFTNSHKLRWKLDFEIVDVIAGREFDLGCSFALFGFGGLRGARINQKVHTNFSGPVDDISVSSSASFITDVISTSSSTSEFTTSTVHGKNKFEGIGPLIGIEADWKFGRGFSLYANASVAVLYGDFRVRFNEESEFIDGADFTKIKRNLEGCQAVVDAGLGIRWQTNFFSKIVWLQLGLEHHRYFNQNRLGSYGDLCLDGANFSAGFAF